MRRLRSFLPLLVLIAAGIALLMSGVLDRFSPQNLAGEQANLQAQIAAHPVLASLVHIGAMALAISTGIPGAVVIIFAGGMLFGVVWGSVLSTIGLTLGALGLFFASRAAFGDHSRGAPVQGGVEVFPGQRQLRGQRVAVLGQPRGGLLRFEHAGVADAAGAVGAGAFAFVARHVQAGVVQAWAVTAAGL